MNLLALLRSRFSTALEPLVENAAERATLAEMVRPSQDPKFGDYQANCAMPLGKQLGQPPRQVAEQLVAALELADICETPEIAGPGFINLRVKKEFLIAQLHMALVDEERLGIAPVEHPRTYLLDYSSPNVAKPMHVGHIRSTVIGHSLYRLLAFLGHRTISDNHIGDWGTQFGMIIYGYKNFRDEAAYQAQPVAELSRLYRLVNQIASYQETRDVKLPALYEQIATAKQQLIALESTAATGDEEKDKRAAKDIRRASARVQTLQAELAALQTSLADFESNAELAAASQAHPQIGQSALQETAKLHAGDEENRRLWREFLPPCLEEIEKTYARLGVTFDYALGESFYHDRLGKVVEDLKEKGLARESNGAMCVFLEGYDAPMIVQKQDGAFLYATTDLATIQYRMEEFSPDAMLYVVDHRQSLHFEQLFATARLWGYNDVELEHVSFGTVLGEDGRPFKTRSGDTVGLMSLLDEAVARAYRIVSENDDAKRDGPELSEAERQQVAEAVGIGALVYADLSQNRTSDYVFSYDKMLAMNGNTATYMQYAHARVRSIFARGGIDPASIRNNNTTITLDHPVERALALDLLRFAEALDDAAAAYQPHQLAGHLFHLAGTYASFFDQCPVLKAETEALRTSRLALSDLTANTLKLGLHLLGIRAVDKM